MLAELASKEPFKSIVRVEIEVALGIVKNHLANLPVNEIRFSYETIISSKKVFITPSRRDQPT